MMLCLSEFGLAKVAVEVWPFAVGAAETKSPEKKPQESTRGSKKEKFSSIIIAAGTSIIS